MDKTRARWARECGFSVRKHPQHRRRRLRSTAACRDPHRARRVRGRHRCESAPAKNGCRKFALDAGFPQSSACSACSWSDDDDRVDTAHHSTNRREHHADARDCGHHDCHARACAMRRECRRDPRRRRAPGNRHTRPAQAAIWKESASTGATVGAKPRGFKQKSKRMPAAARLT